MRKFRKPGVGPGIGQDFAEQQVSSARDRAEVEFSVARERFGFNELAPLALEHARVGRLDEAFGMAREVREVTSEFLQMFQHRGYDVRDTGVRYERALGDAQFRGAERISESDTPLDVVRTVLDATSEAWDGLHDSLLRQAESSALQRITRPESRQSVEDRITADLRAVWSKKFEDVRLGSRVEDLRASVGLRTLSALLQRYSRLDSEGRDDAMPRAYAWAERAYWLTKHGIRHIAGRPEHAAHGDALATAGRGYEEALGDSQLGRGSEFHAGASGWDVIRPTEEVTRRTWAGIKEIISGG